MEERILILVKTYPALSKKYGELVCTAGIRENGEWVRIYPVPFRTLDEYQWYKKFQWIRLNLKRNTKDWRKETFRPVSLISMRMEERVPSERKRQRRELIGRTRVYTNLEGLVAEAKQEDVHNRVSLATFKPAKILGVEYEVNKDLPNDEDIRAAERKMNELTLFDEPGEDRKMIRAARQVPYKFYYRIEDDSGRQSRMIIIDWEISMLFRNCLKTDPEETALRKTVEKYEGFARKNDVYLFLGTTLQFHMVGPQPFMIIGVYPDVKKPADSQMSLFE